MPCLSSYNNLSLLIYLRICQEHGNRYLAMIDAEEIDELEVRLKAFQKLDEERNVYFRVSNVSNRNEIGG